MEAAGDGVGVVEAIPVGTIITDLVAVILEEEAVIQAAMVPLVLVVVLAVMGLSVLVVIPVVLVVLQVVVPVVLVVVPVVQEEEAVIRQRTSYCLFPSADLCMLSPCTVPLRCPGHKAHRRTLPIHAT